MHTNLEEDVMFRSIKARLTPSNAIACIALFAALGGSSYAAATITGASIKDNTLTTKDIKNKSLLAKDFKPGQLPAGPQGATGPQGPQGPQGQSGQPGQKGDAGSTVAYASVSGTGEVAPSESKGVTDAMIRKVEPGVYCIKSVPAGFRTAVVSANNNLGNDDTIASVFSDSSGTVTGCDASAGERIRVRTYDVSEAGLRDNPFNIWFED